MYGTENNLIKNKTKQTSLPVLHISTNKPTDIDSLLNVTISSLIGLRYSLVDKQFVRTAVDLPTYGHVLSLE